MIDDANASGTAISMVFVRVQDGAAEEKWVVGCRCRGQRRDHNDREGRVRCTFRRLDGFSSNTLNACTSPVTNNNLIGSARRRPTGKQRFTGEAPAPECSCGGDASPFEPYPGAF